MFYTLKAVNSIFIPLTIVLLLVTNAMVPAEISEPVNMGFEIGYKTVDRVEVLEAFFAKFNSPLGASSQKFVEVADFYGIDYTILPAISCQESTCGKVLIDGTYNPFGWGIYGDQYIAFESYDEAIEKVGKGLNEGYFAKGYDTLPKIAPIYTPPSNGSWLRGVTWFTNQIGDIALEG